MSGLFPLHSSVDGPHGELEPRSVTSEEEGGGSGQRSHAE